MGLGALLIALFVAVTTYAGSASLAALVLACGCGVRPDPAPVHISPDRVNDLTSSPVVTPMD